VLDASSVDRMERLARRALDATAAATASRVAAGRVCDGHGDLLAEDIFCTAEGPQILDCLEFDDRLRYGDVLADVAFLAMDLERLGHPALAQRFLEHYRRASGDRWPASLEHLHIAYRAHVRSKVTCLRHEQGGDDGARTLARARAFHDLALDHLQRASVDLVLVGGSPGTGKTTVARGVAARLGATRVSTDDVRSEVVDPVAGPAGSLHRGRYAPEQVRLVYDRVLDRARPLLASGVSVVLDASWAREPARTAARQLARESGAHLTELCCTCPPEVAASRITARRAAGGDSSEVTPEIASRLAKERDDWPTATPIDTRPEPDSVLDAAMAAVETAG
jgi:predicted kinase